jgi:hypothetical protein
VNVDALRDVETKRRLVYLPKPVNLVRMVEGLAMTKENASSSVMSSRSLMPAQINRSLDIVIFLSL